MASFGRSMVLTRADTLRRPIMSIIAAGTPLARCRRMADDALAPFGASLPAHRSFELHMILALYEGGEAGLMVPHLPEFLFVMDVGFEALVGVSVPWNPAGLGDPVFPDFGKAGLRSIPAHDPDGLIFSNAAGRLLVSLKEGTPPDEACEGLEDAGLQEIEISGRFAMAHCKPFHERSIAAKVEALLPFVDYAEPDATERIVDFKPGWTVQQLI